jgi:catalase
MVTDVIYRYVSQYDWFGQARTFWSTMDKFAQQHTVDAYRFELGNVGDPTVVQNYIDNTINSIDNCLARRVAYGVGATMPAAGSGPSASSSNRSAKFPSLYPLNPGQEPNKSNEGLQVAIIANDTLTSQADVSAIMTLLAAQKVSLTVVAPHIGTLKTGVVANASFITTDDIFFDAVFVGSSMDTSASSGSGLDRDSFGFVLEAFGHGKPIGGIGSTANAIFKTLGILPAPGVTPGVYTGGAAKVTKEVLDALAGPVRFPQRFPTDDIEAICGSG